MRTVARLAAVAAVSVIMLAIAPGTAPATAPSATIQILSQAQLVPSGATEGPVLVTVYYLCGPATAQAGQILLAVTQPGVKGASPATATCDDQKHKLTLEVGPGPFKPGSASAIADISNEGLSFATAQAEITIK
jgi:hypothetical protein